MDASRGLRGKENKNLPRLKNPLPSPNPAFAARIRIRVGVVRGRVAELWSPMEATAAAAAARVRVWPLAAPAPAPVVLLVPLHPLISPLHP